MRKILFTVLIIVIAALAFVAGDRYGKDQTGIAAKKTERTILYYTDPMNPGFRSEKPGTAPCGMPLEPVYGEVGPDGKQVVTSGGPVQSPGAVTVNSARQQLIGVQIRPVELQPMTHALRLYGKIVPDETRIFRINASTDSWVRELSDITTGSIVGQDQLLAEVLAPAFYNAQLTYLVAMDNLDRIRKQLSGNVRHQQREIGDNQIRLAVQNLQNLGITDAQIEELANTRKSRPYMQVRSPVDGVVLNRNITLYQWFKAGEEFFEIADLARVWVYADVYEDEAGYLRPGMSVKVRHEQSGQSFEAKISQVLPLFDAVAKTLKVRIDVDNLRYDLRPDMFVDVEIPITMNPSLHVPADAVIDSGTRKIVYVAAGDSTFEPRIVETGWRLGRRIEITGGLMPGEKIIVSGNFLVDSESRMKTAAGSIVTAMSKDPVCGMYVNEEYARLTGKTAAFGEKTYYFCMDECRDEFTEEPEKFAQQAASDAEAYMTGDEHGHDASMQTEDDKSWLEMLAPGKGSHVTKKSGTYPGQKMGRKIGTSEGSEGDVDWDGPDSETPRDWGTWGKFPGAKYLGIHDDKKKTVAQHADMQDMEKDSDTDENPSSSDAAAPTLAPDHEVMKEEMRKQHNPDQPVPPADQ
jgi:Cu(I)/Ag(I) efflux system membrane fusion protein